MASKLDEMRAFSKLNKAFPGQYCTLDLEIKRYSHESTVEIKYHAYVAPKGEKNYISGYYDTPIEAVDEILKHFKKGYYSETN